MKMKLYDPAFDNIVIEKANPDDFKKQRALDVISAGLSEKEYVTYEQLEDRFSLSHYQVSNYLDKIGAKPIGIRKNVVNGKRLRGVGKYVFNVDVIEKLNELLHSGIDVEAIKAMAARIKEGRLDENS